MGMLHTVGNVFGLSQEMRNHIGARWKGITRWKPAFYRPVSAWGLNNQPREEYMTISLTTYPGRIKTVHFTVETLLNQTMKPDRVVLWLGEDKFPGKEKDLPKRLLRLREFGLTIGWCRDMRSFTKLLPALKEYPDDIVITADDDIFYPPELVEKLYAAYCKDKSAVYSHSAMMIEGGQDGLTSYNDWWYCPNDMDYSYKNIVMGVNGVLYPPRCFGGEIFNEDVFKAIAPTTDDLWFWAMSVLAGRKICSVDCEGTKKVSTNYMASTASSLWSFNIDAAQGNDKQLAAILERYPLVKERLMADLKS